MLIRGLTFPVATYRHRRARALELVAAAHDAELPLLFLGCGYEELVNQRQDTWFDYYTGCQEPDAALLIDPHRRERDVLFLSPGDPKRIIWDGPRLKPAPAAAKRFGTNECKELRWLERLVTTAAKRAGGRIAMCWREREPGPQSRFAEQWRAKLAGIEVINVETVLAPQRMVKEPAEVTCHRRAIALTAMGLAATFRRLPRLRREAEVAAELGMHYRRNDWAPLAFPTIVGSGVNGATLHYQRNDQPLEPSAPVLIDSGATFSGYCADVTRTVPQHGRFDDKRFREVYELVLAANTAVREAARPGMTKPDLDEVGWALITKAGFKRHHGIGHMLGLDVHDVTDTKDWVLKPGMIITNEPGIYLPKDGFGIRIEDDLLITEDGCEELTAAIPKTIEDVEAAMG